MDKKKEQLLLTVLKMTGMREIYEKQSQTLCNWLKTKYIDVKTEILDNILNNFGPELLWQQLVKIYDEKFSEEDLNNMISFYSTSTGNKMRDRKFLNLVEKTQAEWLLDLEKKLFEYLPKKEMSLL